MYRYLSILTGNKERAEDLMQEVFLKLIRVARRDAQALQNRFYVLRVARNEAYRALAKRRRRKTVQNDGLLYISDPRQGCETERLAIQEALARLPDEQREALHLKVYMNMTFNEIAQFTEVSPNTAASRHRLALEKMRHILGDEEEEK